MSSTCSGYKTYCEKPTRNMPPLGNKNPNEFLKADIYKLITVGI